MRKDERDLLEVLKFELKFLEDGGYGRHPKAPWRPRFIFEDSPTCMNFNSSEAPGPCTDCVLIQLVPPELRAAQLPCRHIPFDSSGETLDSLYRYGDQGETEEVVGGWLRATIKRLEEDRAAVEQNLTKQPTTKVSEQPKEPRTIRSTIRSVQTPLVQVPFIGRQEASSSDFGPMGLRQR